MNLCSFRTHLVCAIVLWLGGCSDAVVLPSQVGGGTMDIDVGEVSDLHDVDSDMPMDSESGTESGGEGTPGAECKSPEDCLTLGEGNPCIAWTCIEGVCGSIPVSDGTKCDDANACTDTSVCQNTECVSEEVDLCDDDNPCTKDTCSPDTGCSWENVTLVCDDGDPCTVDDLCQEGTCEGAPLDCGDANPCTTDSCDSETGCIHEEHGGPCDDGDVCSLEDTCSGGACVSEEALVCEDGNTCTDDTCDSLIGCVFDMNSAACDDEEPCTEEDTCDSGECMGTTVDCSDDFPCTFDSCGESGECEHIAQQDFCQNPGEECTEVSCLLDGGCVYTTDATKCDDGVPCTLDTCSSFKGCENVADDGLCSLDGNVCLVFTCDGLAGCQSTPSVALCDDGFPCTVETCGAGDGLCSYEADDSLCVDPNADCFDFSCLLESGCASEVIQDACDDGIACTLDTCESNGQCSHTPTLSYCEGQTNDCLVALECSTTDGCVFEKNPGNCDDGVACTVDTCLDDGFCSQDPEDSLCDDGTTECFVYTCLAVDGCQVESDPEACDDGVACTTDTCEEDGLCLSTAQLSFCQELTEECLVAEACSLSEGCVFSQDDGACDDGLSCSSESCAQNGACEVTYDNGACDDSNPCTDDVCGINGCENTPNLDPCVAGDSCGGDICQDGSCVPQYEMTCTGKCLEVGVAAISGNNGVCNPLFDCQTYDADGGDCESCGTSVDGQQQAPDCAGICRTGSYLESSIGGGVCKINLDCERFAFDGGDCACAEGMLRDCLGTCFLASELFQVLGDGVCHKDGAGGTPVVACSKFGTDTGDCLLDNTNSGGITSVVNCLGDASTLALIMNLLNGSFGCLSTLNCSKFDYSEGECLAGCSPGLVPSCNHTVASPDCLPMTYLLPKLGNNQCDSLLNCERFNDDEGDCD